LKYETLKSVEFFQFLQCQAPRTNVKPTVEDFVAKYYICIFILVQHTFSLLLKISIEE